MKLLIISLVLAGAAYAQVPQFRPEECQGCHWRFVPKDWLHSGVLGATKVTIETVVPDTPTRNTLYLGDLSSAAAACRVDEKGEVSISNRANCQKAFIKWIACRDYTEKQMPDQEEADLRFIDLRLEAGGGGQLHYATGEVLYAFSTPDQLTTFLEATQAQQAYAIAGQRK